MVPTPMRGLRNALDSPRIRGDGPSLVTTSTGMLKFSPYSRGWSCPDDGHGVPHGILPVFAGMVPPPDWLNAWAGNSPRIRGDGPELAKVTDYLTKFSPYSRGWSDSEP